LRSGFGIGRKRLLGALFALGFVCGISYCIIRDLFISDRGGEVEAIVTTSLSEKPLKGCEEKEYIRYADVMSTAMKVIVHSKSRELAAKVTEAAIRRVAEIEKKMSRFAPDSELYRLNQSAYKEPFVASEELFTVIERSLEFCRVSDGALDITVVPLIDVYKKAALRGTPPMEGEIKDALKRIGWQKVLLDKERRSVKFAVEGMALDLGATAKGYAVDCALEVIKSLGIKHALVEIGGEVSVCGAQADGKEWPIGIVDPRTSHRYLRRLGIKDGAIATSGNYRRYYKIGERQFSHIVNPRTGETSDSAVSVSVIAGDCFSADALATAVSVLGPEQGLALIKKFAGVQALILWKDESGEKTFETDGFAEYAR